MERWVVAAALSVVIEVVAGCGGGGSVAQKQEPGSPCPCSDGLLCVNGKCRETAAAGGCAEGFREENAGAGVTVCLPVDEAFKLEMAPVKLDVLWVIDNTASMVQEQIALAPGFAALAQRLSDLLDGIDLQVAVTTTDAIGRGGQFVNRPATNFPPAGFESRVAPCLSDDDCVQRFGDSWECKDLDAADMYNLNCSVNSQCIFRCEDDSACCQEFCGGQFEAECDGQDLLSCLQEQCQQDQAHKCAFECKQPGQTIASSGCLHKPDTEGCEPAASLTVLTNHSLTWFRCLIQVEMDQSYQANLEQGLKAAWLALDPSGPNAGQSALFLRDDAYLLLVFASDEEDCSIDPAYTSPSYACGSDQDCPAGSRCDSMHRCAGVVWKDYYNRCYAMGEYKGAEHHACAYDLPCNECEDDSDCDYPWHCVPVGSARKCRPWEDYEGQYASFQNPPGFPLFVLGPVAGYAAAFRSLKKDPEKVLVGAFAGDGLPVGPAADGDECPSLISQECLDREELKLCQDFKQVRSAASKDCLEDPCRQGCEELCEAKKGCIRDCYLASKGDAARPTVARNTYVCQSQYGKADFGSRYFKLVEQFGANAVASNLCAPEGLESSLEGLADLVARRAALYCLPQEPQSSEKVVVTVDEGTGGAPQELSEGPEGDGDYELLHDVAQCCKPDVGGECTGGTALRLHQLPGQNATLSVAYVSAESPSAGD